MGIHATSEFYEWIHARNSQHGLQDAVVIVDQLAKTQPLNFDIVVQHISIFDITITQHVICNVISQYVIDDADQMWSTQI